jgi:hypothetical protein
MGRAINLALTKREAIHVAAILDIVANSPHVWREADGWDHQLNQTVLDRLAEALDLENVSQP